MTDVDQLRCGRCGRSDVQVLVQGVATDPPGWSVVTLSGQPVSNQRCCPSCSADVRHLLASQPVSRLDREQALDVVTQSVWRDGYEAGCNDSENSAYVIPDVAAMCHWAQDVDGAQDAQNHAEYHFGYPCPYEAIAAVLRGERDPREAAA